MTPLPPRRVPFALAGSYPELQVVPEDSATIVHDLVGATSGFGALLSSIEEQGIPAASSGWANTVPITLAGGKPAKDARGDQMYRLQLTDETLTALTPVIAGALAAALSDQDLQGVLWTIHEGPVPGPESGGASAPSWSLQPFAALPGVICTSAGYDGATRRITLACVNPLMRYLGIYAVFTHGGQPLAPAGWKSRLPAGVPAVLETATQKYLGVLSPSVAVAGMPSPAAAQPVTVVLPPDADAAVISFGGFGADRYAAIPCAAGVMLSFVLGYAVPAIIASTSTTNGFYEQLVVDAGVRSQVLTAAAGLAGQASVTDPWSLLDWLAINVPALLLGDDLAGLRDRLDAELGDGSVAGAAPHLGWAAQALRSALAAPAPGFSPLAAPPAQVQLSLGPNTAVTVSASVLPDARTGDWRDEAQSYELAAAYGNGFSLAAGGALPGTPPGAPIEVRLPSVRTGAPIILRAAILGGGAQPLSQGAATLSVDPPVAGGAVNATITVVDEPVPVTAATTFARRRTLAYAAPAGYAWGPAAGATVTRSSLNCNVATNQLCELVGITLQSRSRSIGYTWRSTDSGVPDCASRTPTATSYAFQNIGSVGPAAMLKTISCGFAGRPELAYADSAAVCVDPRFPRPVLRAVALDSPGPFDLGQISGLGCFLAADLTRVALHPEGFALAISATGNRVELVTLSPAPVADAAAPVSRVIAGAGSRVGLVNAPVGCAVAPSGLVLVLEHGNARLQAFDTSGNPVGLFAGGSAVAALKGESSVQYQDVAVSASGLIYVLSYVNGGVQPADYRLDVYTAAGSFLARTTGVNAAAIAVDAEERVFTLDYASLRGAGGRTEPVISLWTAVGAGTA